jgi:PBP1b-binding outer membrane lipoprotein LpoB
MKNLKSLFFIIIASLLFSSCSKNENKVSTTTKDTTTAKKESIKQTEQINTILGGLWISDEDSKSSINITSNLWLEMYENEKTDTFKFALGDSCLANPDSKANANGKYITVFDPEGNRCFFIVKFTNSKLELSYVGRGNTLRYTKKSK